MLSVMAPNGENPRCPSAGMWINELVYVNPCEYCAIGYYVVMKGINQEHTKHERTLKTPLNKKGETQKNP